MAQESRNQPLVGPKESVGLILPQREALGLRKAKGTRLSTWCPKQQTVPMEHTARYGHFSGNVDVVVTTASIY